MRFFVNFVSFNRLFVGSCSLKGPFNYSRVFGDSLVGGVLEGASLTSRITLRFSKVS
jgi:hypothetical protein